MSVGFSLYKSPRSRAACISRLCKTPDAVLGKINTPCYAYFTPSLKKSMIDPASESVMAFFFLVDAAGFEKAVKEFNSNMPSWKINYHAGLDTADGLRRYTSIPGQQSVAVTIETKLTMSRSLFYYISTIFSQIVRVVSPVFYGAAYRDMLNGGVEVTFELLVTSAARGRVPYGTWSFEKWTVEEIKMLNDQATVAKFEDFAARDGASRSSYPSASLFKKEFNKLLHTSKEK